MLPILLAFAAGVLLAHVLRHLLAHRAQDLAGPHTAAARRGRDAWLHPSDEDVIRRSRDLSQRLASGESDSRPEGSELAPRARVPARVSASPLRGFGVTFRVRR